MRLKVSYLIVFNLCLLIGAVPSPQGKATDQKCGYESCHTTKSDMLNVHIVPHTHDDVGWLKTVDQYYFGSKGNVQKASVQYIIDSVVQGLLQNPDRRYIYVELAFFTKWWKEQDDAMKETVKMLVNEGRLEFIGGAWTMNDEAATHYQSIIDQFTWGLKFLNETFGECGRPKIGWQLDPFGHSREQASLFTKMGFEGLFFSRLDYQDKIRRVKDREMEMVWKSSDHLDDSDLFTGATNNTWYNAPDLFCFDYVCTDEPIIDDKNSFDYNVDRRVEEFVNVLRIQQSYYRSNNIMLTMGGDFTWIVAHMYFKNLDKLIKYTNERQDKYKINAIYSTPSCYLKALHDSNVEWPTKSDDFFPYASDPYSYWTGYFTSRPTSKRFERDGNRFLQVCKKLSSTVKNPEDSYETNLSRLNGIMGIMQHHDAITGTEKQNVADDYHRELHAAIIGCETNTKSALNQFVTGKEPSAQTPWEFEFNSCLNLNISVCDVPEKSEKFVVTVYNTLAHKSSQYVRFPVGGSSYKVQDAANEIPNQILPIPQPLKELHYRESTSTNELVFQASGVPALGYKSYFVTRLSGVAQANAPKRLAAVETIGNDDLKITFGTNGLLQSITVDGATSDLSQTFMFYKGANMNNMIFANRSSGAYIFRPDPLETLDPIATDVTVEVFRGLEVDEVHQKFNDWVSQVVRVYKKERFVEFEYLVGPIDIEDGYGKEIVSRFETKFKTEGEFYTDANGRQMLKRIRDKRETWDLQMQEPVSGNYYPINTKIVIEEGNNRLAVLTDRACGGSSMVDGTVELMVHRRLLRDDTFGVDEALNETAYGEGLVTRGKHWLVFGKKNQNPTMEAYERILQNNVLMSNWLFFDDGAKLNYDEWKTKYTHSHSAIASELPENLYLMSFEPWRKDSYLLRLEHIIDKGEDSELSKPVKFNLKDVFPGDHKFEEVSLAGNQWIEDMNRLKFNQKSAKSSNEKTAVPHKALADLEITLNPFQMRTFIMSPASEPSHGIRSQTVFKFFPFVVLAIVIKNIF